ncbi:DUF721 domain-containing protein [Deinococcus sp. Marseille-Q6407]|uniref:DUF721 domain-containing protein n=1 Tax=Deinococcus sp. Marseille-Q6407 TaxID=2969223 RepID=UPI0021BE733E|nr:DUF721 domain-containing protein [Deinococcus sp. Marseille-Q6407]
MSNGDSNKPYIQKPSYRTRARSGRREGDLRSVGELMDATLGKNRLGFGVRRAQALLLWPRAVGPEVARLTRARSFQFGTLHVEARDSAAAHHLSMQRHHFMHRLNELLISTAPAGVTPEQVTEIRFGTGWTAPGGGNRRSLAPQLPPLPPEEQARAEQAAQAAGEELHDVARAAAEAVARSRRWREQQGWTPCPVCGEPDPHLPCRACERTMRDPVVRRAADELMRRPEAILGLEDRLGPSAEQAAYFLAVQGLEGRLKVLALECIHLGSAAEYHEFFEEQCGHLLAVMGRKPLSDVTAADYDQLPEQVLQVLKAGRAAARRR